MIYVFKISLKDVGRPVWRRIQIDSSATFFTLHRVIQTAFDWTGYHLHQFEIRKSAGKKTEWVTIDQVLLDEEVVEADKAEEDQEEDDDFLRILKSLLSLPENSPTQLNEKEEQLENWFKQEKDRAIYTYDFGDDWQHEIVLEKIISSEFPLPFPICVKAKNEAPPEDSRWEVIRGEVDLEHPHPKELAEEITEYLQDEAAYEDYLEEFFTEDF